MRCVWCKSAQVCLCLVVNVYVCCDFSGDVLLLLRYRPTALFISTNNTFLAVIGTYHIPQECDVYDSVVAMYYLFVLLRSVCA